MYFGIGLLLAVIEAVANSSRLTHISEQLHASFAETFFMALLPPIIFESGFSMEKKPFFGNFWSICVFAFLGTLLSMVVIGAMIMAGSATGAFIHFSAVDALLFGSIMSSTDPVTVLAVFQVGTNWCLLEARLWPDNAFVLCVAPLLFLGTGCRSYIVRPGVW